LVDGRIYGWMGHGWGWSSQNRGTSSFLEMSQWSSAADAFSNRFRWRDLSSLSVTQSLCMQQHRIWPDQLVKGRVVEDALLCKRERRARTNRAPIKMILFLAFFSCIAFYLWPGYRGLACLAPSLPPIELLFES
jgi:hypothetical protein